MPGYIKNVLHKFQHSSPTCPQHSPYNINPHKTFIKGHQQYVMQLDTSLPLDAAGILCIQSIVGCLLLYYAHAIDYSTLLTALNTISANQSKPTTETNE